MKKKPFTSVIITAGGNGRRMDSTKNKLLIKLGDKTIIEMTLSAFDKAKTVDEIIVAIPEIEKKVFEDIITNTVKNKILKITIGGECRELSVKNGIEIINKSAEFVAVHDAARPLITPEEIDEINETAYISGNICCGTEIKNTIKKIDKNGNISKTLKREFLFSAATPQIFKKEDIYYAFNKFSEKLSEFTDDASVVEAAGFKVKIFYCNERNIKITTQSDIKLAEKFLNI